MSGEAGRGGMNRGSARGRWLCSYMDESMKVLKIVVLLLCSHYIRVRVLLCS
jgi:hypothetical protein